MTRTNLISILLCLCGVYGVLSQDPLVQSNVGAIRGLTSPDGTYSMFLGIPYATVDHANPFGPSIPQPPFEDIFDAFDDSAVCPHQDEFNNTLIGTLDCLNLNVYVPNTASSTNPVPVLVWIHGGGFRTEYGGRVTEGPKYLVRHDVIVINFTYRLGPYGFLCLDTPEVPGNQGLKDQILALRWIKNNIEAFGGDPNRITVSGQSAGAISIDFHLIYTNEELFHNAIMQSGTTITPFVFEQSDPDAPIKMAEHLGFTTDNISDALSFLSTVDTDSVITASAATNLNLGPCVEKEFENVDNLITTHPLNMNITRAKDVPILIGFNDNELGSSYENFIPIVFQNLIFFLLGDHFDFETAYLVEMEALVRRFYIGDEDVDDNVKQDLIDFGSDNFLHAAYRSIDKYQEAGASTIYNYMFTYAGDRNFAKKKYNVPNVRGAIHGDEISYLFDVLLFNETPTAEDQLVIDRITTLWTNFAKYSNPIPQTTDLLPVQWPVVTEDIVYCMDIGSELSLGMKPFYDRMAFWDLFYKMNGQFLRGLEEN